MNRIILSTASVLLLASGVFADDAAQPSWVRVTEKAGWTARDSQGELVYKNRLWIFGGWMNSFEAPPRDVWSSANGKNWTRITAKAPCIHSDLSMSLTFKNRMWFMGGWYNGRLPGHSASNQVWSSTDGKAWTRATGSAGWTPRLAAALIEFKGRMWMLGGTENYYFGNQKSLKNDVWSTADGKTWTRATDNAGWAPRAYHQAAVLGERMYVFGGGNYVPEYKACNDVWSTTDGKNWEPVTSKAAWHPRLWFSSVFYRDHMWVLGGWSNKPSKNWGDAWYSRDGKTWTEYKPATTWKARHEHSAYVLDGKLWIVGGHAKPLCSEVWTLSLPAGWPASR